MRLLQRVKIQNYFLVLKVKAKDGLFILSPLLESDELDTVVVNSGVRSRVPVCGGRVRDPESRVIEVLCRKLVHPQTTLQRPRP